MKLLLLIIGALFCFPVFAADGLETVLSLLGPLLGPFIAENAWAASLLKWVVYGRIFLKPAMSAWLSVEKNMGVEWSFKKTMQNVSNHWAYKGVAFFLDWAFSLKLPKKQE